MTILPKNTLACALVSISVCASAGAQSPDWALLGHTSARHSLAVDGPNQINLDTLDWIAWQDPWDPQYYLEFIGPGSPVLYDGRVFAHAKYFNAQSEYTHNQIIAFNAETGEDLWAAPIDKGVLDSWSSPAVDTKNQTVLIGSGKKIFALNINSGNTLWSTTLNRSIVNASVCTALDLPHARAFITDYTGTGSSDGRLYCLNLDPNTPDNPYRLGAVIWSEQLGSTSGNTPAYHNGVVYVTSITDPNSTWAPVGGDYSGALHAYNADTNFADRLWRTWDSNFEGFFGGLTVTKAGFLYAANYDYYGGEDNAALCKINADDGAIVWTCPTERTCSIPIVVGDKIYLSGGTNGYGSRPKLQAYQDLGDSAVKLWETPASLIIGGWSHQPVYANGKLYIGAIPTANNYHPYTDLFILDTSLTPTNPGFFIAQYHGCGSSPALTPDSLYSIGHDGLHKFYQPALRADIYPDRRINLRDIYEMGISWLFDGPLGINRADLNLDGRVDFFDFNLLAQMWHKVMQ